MVHQAKIIPGCHNRVSATRRWGCCLLQGETQTVTNLGFISLPQSAVAVEQCVSMCCSPYSLHALQGLLGSPTFLDNESRWPFGHSVTISFVALCSDNLGQLRAGQLWDEMLLLIVPQMGNMELGETVEPKLLQTPNFPGVSQQLGIWRTSRIVTKIHTHDSAVFFVTYKSCF